MIPQAISRFTKVIELILQSLSLIKKQLYNLDQNEIED